MAWLTRARPLGLLVLACALGSSRVAHAEVGQVAVSAGARGTIGGALLGGEAILLLEAALGFRPVWLYAVGGGAGAIGGAIGGLQSDEAGNAPLSMGLLVGGLLLVVPTTIAVLSATSYHAPTLGNAVSTGPRPWPAVLSVPTPALLHCDSGSFSLGLPALEFSPVYSKLEQVTWGVPNTSRLLLPILRMTF